MAKKPKKAERKQKLKVFRTPIGFHDAYVAAPSQKAALEAWGADSNLFAQVIAEQVDDPKLMEEALANPGQVVRRLRGGEAEHFAELAKSQSKLEKKEKSRIKPGPAKKEKAPRPPKPSRADLDDAEEKLEAAEKRQRGELREIEQKIQALERQLRTLQRQHESERDELAEARDRARSAYERAKRQWDKK